MDSALHVVLTIFDIAEGVSFFAVVVAQILLRDYFFEQGTQLYLLLLKSGTRAEKLGVRLMVVFGPILFAVSMIYLIAYS